MTKLQAVNLGITLGQKPLIQALDLLFEPGQFWGILGPNGVGKTTLLQTLAGLHAPTQGEVLLDGCLLQRWPTKKRARNVGLLLQETEFTFPASTLEVVVSGRYPYSGKQVRANVSEAAFVQSVLESLALETFSTREIHTLSGGEKQRVLLASLLVQNPNVYLLDEPINHLDIQQSQHVLSLFQKLVQQKNKTVVAVLHEPRLISRFCTHWMILEQDNIQWGVSTDGENALSQYTHFCAENNFLGKEEKVDDFLALV